MFGVGCLFAFGCCLLLVAWCLFDCVLMCVLVCVVSWLLVVECWLAVGCALLNFVGVRFR